MNEHIDWTYLDEVSIPVAGSYEDDDNHLRPMKFEKYELVDQVLAS